MEILAAVGQYLLLAFVLPGLCYLLVFAVLYGDVFHKIREEWPADAAKESSQGLWMSAVAVGAGLLLSSVTFAIEILFRGQSWFERWFPEIDFTTVALHEKGVLAAGASIMHFNIALGIFLILLPYPIYACRLDKLFPPANDEEKRARPTRAMLRGCFAVAVAVLTCANLAASSAMFHRTQKILVAVEKAHQANWRLYE